MPEIVLTTWQILLVKVAVILVIVPMGALVGGYAEHKVMAHLQHRLGPMYPGGFHGWATTLADGIKFLYK
jgi:NADH-quinone oxidoreductase subunit H